MRQTRNLAAVMAVAFLIGCSSLWTGTVTITSVVDSAMKNWAEMSAAGKSSQAIDAAVIKAHDQYRAACSITQVALVTYKQTGNQAEYVKALTALRASAGGIIDLIAPLLSPGETSTLRTQLGKAGGI